SRQRRYYVGRLVDGGGGDRPETDSEFGRDDLGKGGLADSGRPGKEHVVERPSELPRGGDEYREVLLGGGLAVELRKRPRALDAFVALPFESFRHPVGVHESAP